MYVPEILYFMSGFYELEDKFSKLGRLVSGSVLFSIWIFFFLFLSLHILPFIESAEQISQIILQWIPF